MCFGLCCRTRDCKHSYTIYPGQSLIISLDDNRDELTYVYGKPVENASLGLAEACSPWCCIYVSIKSLRANPIKGVQYARLAR
jgi:hypothetical protein